MNIKLETINLVDAFKTLSQEFYGNKSSSDKEITFLSKKIPNHFNWEFTLALSAACQKIPEITPDTANNESAEILERYVVSVISETYEDMAVAARSVPRTTKDATDIDLDEFVDIARWHMRQDPSFFELLLIYLYDVLFSLYLGEKYKEAVSALININKITESIRERSSKENSRNLHEYYYSSRLNRISSNARKAANARHQKLNMKKAELVDQWLKESKHYNSRADFVRIFARPNNLLERTLYDWLAEADKKKAATITDG